VRRPLLLSLLAATALSAFAAPAQASPSQFSIFDASEELGGSLCCPGESQSALHDASTLGADTVRLLVHWRDVVADPTAIVKPGGDSDDPSWTGYGQPSVDAPYRGWGRYDEAIRGIVARGMSVLLVPTGTYPDGRAPSWAGRGPDGTDPDPTQYYHFMRALGTRYRGGYDPDGPGPLQSLPAISYVGVWNEPNSPFQLEPQTKDGAPYTPILYRHLYTAGRAGLIDGGYRGQIWIAELAPRSGTPETLGALEFTRQMLCLTNNKGKKGKGKRRRKGVRAGCLPLEADAFAHHPYTGVDPPFRPPFAKQDVDIANLTALIKLLRQAAKVGAINSLPMVLDEYGVQSNPPDPLFGLGFQTQAEYIGIAEFMAYRIPGIAAWPQYLDRDDADQGGFQSGLRLRDGTVKPAYDAYRTPLVAKRGKRCVQKARRGNCTGYKLSKRVTLWGEVRSTGSAHVQVERNDGGSAWKAATPPLVTDAGGYFQRKVRYRRGRQFRLVWFDGQDGSSVCAGDCIGPAIRAYAFK
jgi:hypothetical protein